MLEFLQSTELIEVVAGVVGALWAFFKGTEWYTQYVGNKYQSVVNIVESVVNSIYENYVRERKADATIAPEGKLAEEERSEARTRAVNLVKELAARKGLNLEKLVGSDEDLEALVQKTVSELKIKYNR